MTPLPHRLDRTLLIRAHREIVFAYFTESPRWAAWWGAGSTIEAHAGGRMYIRHPNGVEASGEVLQVQPPERIVFTYGYESGVPIPPGGSRVTVRLDAHPAGTLLHLAHEFADVNARDEHVQGWRFQLSQFSNLVANEAAAGTEALVDRWFEAWNEPEAGPRDQQLASLAATGIRVNDRYSCLEGIDDLQAHMAAVHRFMPGLRMKRHGAVRHCQWQVLADWTATGKEGQPRGGGTTLFLLDCDGRIASVTAFWTTPVTSE
jgi:uncharacterized protein YndB with AHSA1/START domain